MQEPQPSQPTWRTDEAEALADFVDSLTRQTFAALDADDPGEDLWFELRDDR